MIPFDTDTDNVTDAGTGDYLVNGWRDAADDGERHAWLRLQASVLQDGGPELLEAVRAVEQLDHGDPYGPELEAACEADDGALVGHLITRRNRVLAEQRTAAYARVRAELVKLAVRTATTPRLP